MKKQEILDMVNQLPDDVEIDLVVSEIEGDNTEVERLVVNRLDETEMRDSNGNPFPAELVFVLGEGYFVGYEREEA